MEKLQKYICSNPVTMVSSRKTSRQTHLVMSNSRKLKIPLSSSTNVLISTRLKLAGEICFSGPQAGAPCSDLELKASAFPMLSSDTFNSTLAFSRSRRLVVYQILPSTKGKAKGGKQGHGRARKTSRKCK